MAASIEQVTHEALTLSEPERAQLAWTLLGSLDSGEGDGDVESAWEAEIARRVETVYRGTAAGRPADEVFQELAARHA